MPPKKRKADSPATEEPVVSKKTRTAAPRKVVQPKKTAPATKSAPAKKPTKAKTVTKKATTTKKAPAKKAVAEESDSSSSDEEEAPAKPIKKAAPKKAPAKKAAPKEAAPKKAVPAKKTAAKKAAPKRKADEQSGSDEESSGSDIEEPPAKKPATHAKPKKEPVLKAVVPKAIKFGPTINKAPTQLLDVFVFGEGSAGELGLGNKTIDNKKPIDVKRPRYNEKLSKMGIVEISVGGMHCVALTSDNRIVTWGVNDQGALGRDTTYEGGLRDMDAAESDDSDDEDALNPYESTPNYVDAKHFEEGTVFTNVVASDSASFAVTADGQVYGWGTFRSNDGILGFEQGVPVQVYPKKVAGLKKITKLAAGANHILALDFKNNVWAWGSGQQNQLGRRVVERTRTQGLTPREFGLPRGKIVDIACGGYHSFAIHQNGKVFAWGLNNFGETGITDGAGEDGAVIPQPTIVTSLEGYEIKHIDGGGHHSLACTADGKVLAFGRSDGFQLGIDLEDVPKENFVYDERENPRFVKKPVELPDIHAVQVACGHDNSFAITKDGKAYSWGFSANYQTGQGSDDDVEEATLIDNTAVRDRKLVWAGAGGQFSILAAHREA